MSGNPVPREVGAARSHDPIAYEFVRAMGPAEFIEAANRLNDRRQQLHESRMSSFEPGSADSREQLLAGLGTVALENVAIAEDDRSRDAEVIRIARQMGDGGLDGLWRAESTVDHILSVRSQLEKQPDGPFLFFREQDGGLAIEAGRTNGAVSWRMDRQEKYFGTFYLPELVIAKDAEDGTLVCDPWCRIVTDTEVPDYLIWDYVSLTSDDGEDYQGFLKDHFGDGETKSNEFPNRATMLALGDEGVTKLISEFNRLTQQYYQETPFGRLESRRINKQAAEALHRIRSGERNVTLGPHPNLRADYEDVLTEEMRHMARQAGLILQKHFDHYDIIEQWYRGGKALDVLQLSRWLADSMYERQGKSIDHDDLLVAIKEEMEKEIALQREHIAQHPA